MLPKEGFFFGLTISILLFAAILHCGKEASARPDLGVSEHLVLSFGPTLNGNTNPKFAALGFEKIWDDLSLLTECRGIFSDPINGACSLVASARVETVSGLFMRVGAGPAWVFRKDDRVSSNFNFNIQGAIGITNQDVDIGLCYSHFSNAGLVPPNLGRDFIGPVIEIKI